VKFVANDLTPEAGDDNQSRMQTVAAFDLGLSDYSVHQLSLADAALLQRLFEQCLDFNLLVEGRAPASNAAEEEFSEVPPGKSLADKFLFGLVNRQNDLVGCLDVLRGYPDAPTWWIGLLLLAPEVRAHGLGPQVLQGLAQMARASGAQAFMLGVVEENQRAYQFWARMGFELVRTTEPRQFGNKTQTVSVMRRSLSGMAMASSCDAGNRG
jgi:GNAT superfamily N-acetyltransferase